MSRLDADLFIDDDLPPWYRDAACADVDTRLFFPEDGATATDARSVCQECPVQAVCLAYALDTRQDHGVWGGTTAQERAKLRRQRQAA